MAAVLALVSAVGFGISDFSGGLASRRVPATAIVMVSNGLSLVLALAAVAFIPGSTFVATDLTWGVAAGSVGLLGVVLLYRGLAIGPMSVVAPLTAVLSATVPVVVGIVRGERPGTLAVVGIAVALPAMVLIGRDRGQHGGARISRAGLVSALSAGVSFGAFYVVFAQTGSHSGAWPLVGQRAASVTLLLVLAVAGAARSRAIPIVPGGRVLALAALAGVTDFSANLSYLLATHQGLLALVAVLSSLYPAATLLLARLVLRERLARPQLGGLALAVVAAGLIAAR